MRAARKCGYPTPAACVAELVQHVESHAQGLFIGFDGERPAVTACGFLPANAFWLAATVCFAYSDKAPRHIAALVGKRLRGWLMACGHDHAIVLNLFYPDEVYIRGLSYFGFGERIGGVIKFSF